MLAGIHQLHYLPWLRYFEKIARADVFIVLDDIQFTKNDWQNRNRIKAKGGPVVLTLPIQQKYQQRLDQCHLDNRLPWRRKHWESLRQAYGKTPYFDRYAPALEGFYAREWDHMNALNRAMLDYFLQALGITTEIVYASELKVPGSATERLIGLMKAVGADEYYSGAYALEVYLDADALELAGIGLQLQEWTAPVYPQLHGDFVKDLAIVDLLFNCGPDSLRVLLEPNP
ncbi:MAG: hypothetical protein GC168_08110 [Candidatus Hydrogenedens sp.]|nr:hypothetical protein [Candidatus Hydrogenedens sp.]